MTRRRVVAVAAEVLAATGLEAYLYLAYQAHDARAHWFMHFFLGASAALVVMTALALTRGRMVRLPLLGMVAGHLVAIVPDVLFAFGIPHRPWMDVFLAHVSSHAVPGGTVIWADIFAGCLAAYLIVAAKRAHTTARPPAG